MAMTIFYPVGDHLYVNLTNRCPCSCTFCIRQNGNGAYGSDSLWLSHEPDMDEIRADIAKWNLKDFTEIVFCGYGEPTEAIAMLCACAAYIKTMPDCPPIRLNTNGLSDLIHGRKTARLLKGLIDIVSISLNAGTREAYMAVTRPRFENAFEAMQQFAVECKDLGIRVMFTVVDVIPQEEIAAAQQIANQCGIPLRVRTYES